MNKDHARTVEQVLASSSSAAFSPLAASWCRSGLRHGLAPEAISGPSIVTGGELAERRERLNLLLDVATPLLDQLYQTVAATGCAVMLSDTDGVILEARTQDSDRTMFDRAGLTPGGVWSEDVEGTNGIGTCLVEGRAVTIHRDQHFASRNIDISCMDAPIHDAEGRLVAALDVSSCRDDHSAAMAMLVQKIVQDAARRIERGVFYRHFSGRRIIDANEPGGDAALIAVDHDDLLVGATRAARLRFALTDACLVGNRSAADLLGEGSAASFRDSERATLRRALAASGGNASQAARTLGIGRATLYRRMARVGLPRG
jgi:transcriptional regulator of acetoin/glycerol metabolism